MPISATHAPLLHVYGPYKPFFCLPYNKTSNKGQRSVKKLLQTIDVAVGTMSQAAR